MAIIAFVIVIVTLACALVIYSWFFVSTIRKTNEYGKLRMIGATGRQVRRIVIKEERRLAVNTIPIGLIAGMAAGYILVPDGWNIASVLTVGVFVAALMYLCVMLTIRRPAKFALKVTPIEAVCVALC
jgi:putative ABC transport system permease protein